MAPPDHQPPPTGTSDASLELADALAQLSFAIQGVLGRVVASFDSSVVQARLLGILRHYRPTINELARVLGLDKSSVTGLVDRAEQRGLVRRLSSELDRRSVHVVITPAGQRLADRAGAAFEAEVAHLVAGLTAGERDRLAALASRVVSADVERRGVSIRRSHRR